VGITNISRLIAVAVGLGFFALTPARALAHCDGLDGPVVKAAQRALETRNPALVLIWVQEQDEPEIRKAFEQTLAVRALSPQAKELADRSSSRRWSACIARAKERRSRDFNRRAVISVRRFRRRTKLFGSVPSSRSVSYSPRPFKNGSAGTLGRWWRHRHSHPTMSLRAARTSRRTWSSFIS
jgi:hypothetical protein